MNPIRKRSALQHHLRDMEEMRPSLLMKLAECDEKQRELMTRLFEENVAKTREKIEDLNRLCE
jgi:hypothetical protein